MSHFRTLCLTVLTLLAVCAGADAPARAQQPDATLGVALRNLASRAANVFVGQITSIDRAGDVVAITFRVDTPIAGTAPNPFVLREWAGLWPLGEARYYVGQRALVLLHAPSGSGFASPVDGADGMIPVLPQGADQEPLLDVRRLDARVLRAAGEPLPDATRSAIRFADAATLITHCHDAAWQEPTRLALPREVSVPNPPRSPAPLPAPPQRWPLAPHPTRPVMPVQPLLPAPDEAR